MSSKKRFLLRIDQKVYDALEKWAADDLRSVNAQIEYVLTGALKGAGRLGDARPGLDEGVHGQPEEVDKEGD